MKATIAIIGLLLAMVGCAAAPPVISDFSRDKVEVTQIVGFGERYNEEESEQVAWAEAERHCAAMGDKDTVYVSKREYHIQSPSAAPSAGQQNWHIPVYTVHHIWLFRCEGVDEVRVID